MTIAVFDHRSKVLDGGRMSLGPVANVLAAAANSLNICHLSNLAAVSNYRIAIVHVDPTNMAHWMSVCVPLANGEAAPTIRIRASSEGGQHIHKNSCEPAILDNGVICLSLHCEFKENPFFTNDDWIGASGFVGGLFSIQS